MRFSLDIDPLTQDAFITVTEDAVDQIIVNTMRRILAEKASTKLTHPDDREYYRKLEDAADTVLQHFRSPR